MKAAIPVNSQSTAIGLMIRKVVVEQVVPERSVAIVNDKMGYITEVPYRVQQGRGVMPKVGQVWYIDRSMGPWIFSALVVNGDDDFRTFPDGVVIPEGGQLKVGDVNVTNQASLAVRRPNATDPVEAYGVDGDGSSRFLVTAEGRIGWGAGGTAARDTFLYRSAASTLKTDGKMIVSGELTVNYGSVTGPALAADDWGSLPLASGYEHTPSNPGFGYEPQIRRLVDDSTGKGVVELRGTIAKTGGGTFASGNIPFVLSTSFRPPSRVFRPIIGSLSTSGPPVIRGEANENGNFIVSWSSYPSLTYSPTWICIDGFIVYRD